MPPIVVRRQERWGLAFRAIVAIVPCATGEPDGVYDGDVVTARRVTYCVYAVNRIIGSPSAMTIRAPGKTQSGSPMPTIDAFATTATRLHAAAYTARDFWSMPRAPGR